MGVAKPVHALTPIASVRRIVNMVTLAVVEAQAQRAVVHFNFISGAGFSRAFLFSLS